MKKQRHETEFLPAALELEETPASPAGRLTIWVIVLLFSSGIAWASIGQVDIVTVARGKIIPNGHTKQIQAMEIGTVKAIHVQEGQSVKQGDVLIELDDQSAKADEQRLSEEQQMLKKDIERLKMLLSGLADESSALNPSLDGLGMAQWEEYVKAKQSLVSARDTLKVEQNSIQAQIEKYQQLLPILTKKAQNYKKLSKKKMLAEQQYLEAEQQRIEMAHDQKTLQARKAENLAKIKEAEDKLQHYTSEYKRTLLQSLDETQRRAQAINQELIKAQKRVTLQTLKAPVDGVVQQLAVHTIGGVVTPAQALMVIVPKETALEVEAFVENKDIGFVEEGMLVEVKIDAFPFTKYGVIDGEISHLSKDAVADEQMGLIYKARIALNSHHITVNGKDINLSPGMTVSAETKTGKRRMIEYFMSPLLRYKDESVRER